MFESFSMLCLSPCDWLADCYPCPIAPGCAFRIRPPPQLPPSAHFNSQLSTLNPQPFIGHCERNPAECPQIELSKHEITPLELNWEKLGRAISKALALDTKINKLPIPHTFQIGTWSADAVPVILTIQTERRHFRSVVCELIARLHQKFILLAPTNQHFDALSQELLATVHAAAFALETIVALTPNGNLQPAKTPGELFAKFNPEEKLPDDAALRAFAILKSMDSEVGVRKAPVFTVFRLYCVENLSANEIAKRLRCGKTTIVERLRLIRKKTGADPKNLRAYSAQFTHIEQSLSDPRAKRIQRQAAMDDTPPDEKV